MYTLDLLGWVKRSDIKIVQINVLSRDMRFPKMWYVRPTKPQISLRIRTV